MQHQRSLRPAARGRSFVFAINGLYQVLRGEPNAWVHAAATVVAIAAAIIRHITATQWLALIFAIGLVWVTETMNTAIEKLCDFSCDNKYHQAIKVVKDIAAAAVMMAAAVSVAIGFIIFFL